MELIENILAAARRGQSVYDWLPQALVHRFSLQSAHIELYDHRKQTITLVGEAGAYQNRSPLQPVGPNWKSYKSLTLGQAAQLCPLTTATARPSAKPSAWLGCPMLATGGQLLGVVWLVRFGHEIFAKAESKQLQHVVDCAAIAVHQSQLQQVVETQQDEIQQLRQAKDEFLQLISHELFVPLGSIQLSAQTLEKIFKDASWRKVPQRNTVLKVLSLLSQECRRQKQFVDNLITLMFPEYQKLSEPVLMNLSDWLPSLLRTFEPRFKQEDLKFSTNIPKEPLLLECDVAQLERVVAELITNTIKYTPAKKSVVVTVNTSDSHIKIAIANTGIQIPPSHQPHIFEKFYRIPELDQRQYGGSGLGLSLVKQLVTNLDGTIAVKSTPQKTTFTVTLPRQSV
ncbi:MAG: ATP-binding protein [Leptolyngbyaceae cyanobacterium]